MVNHDMEFEVFLVVLIFILAGWTQILLIVSCMNICITTVDLNLCLFILLYHEKF